MIASDQKRERSGAHFRPRQMRVDLGEEGVADIHVGDIEGLKPHLQGALSPARNGTVMGYLSPMSGTNALQRAIRDYLARTGESERALSEKAGLNHKAVNQILNGKTETNRGSTLTKLAAAMGLDLADLLRDDFSPGAHMRHAQPSGALTIREYDVGASAGYGAEPPVLNGDNETPVLAEWSMPEDLVQAHTTPDRRLAIIRVEGDSMEPEYHPGERVLVDLSRRKPSPPGIFIIWDGMGLVLKRVELVPGLIPRRIRLSSINPGYTPYEVELDEHTIVARVIGKWQWR